MEPVHPHLRHIIAMMRTLLLGITLALAILVACGDDDEEVVPGDTGITGQALAGPQCPVVQAGSPCPDQPIQVTLVVVDESGDERSFETNVDGTFRIDLQPGEYTVKAQPVDDSGFPTPPSDQLVTVVEGSFTDVPISYDTGIR